MAWSQPRTWSSDKITDEVLNAEIRDKMDALKDPPSDSFTETYTGSSYATTTSTSFTDIGGSYSLALTTGGGDILVCFNAFLIVTTQAFIDISVNGNRVGGSDGILSSDSDKPVGLYWLLTEKVAGDYTISVQWKTSGSVTLSAGQLPQFWAREIS